MKITISITYIFISLFLTLLSLIPVAVKCQSVVANKKIDSLNVLLQHAKQDTVKAKLYHQIAELFFKENPSEALRYGKKALAFAKASKDTHHIIRALMHLAPYHDKLTNYNLALEILQEALVLNKGLKGQPYKAKIYYRQAEILFESENYDSAESLVQLALKATEDIRDNIVMCDAHMLMGAILVDGKHNKKAALDHFILATKIAEESGDMEGAAMGYGNVANELAGVKEYAKAIQYARRCLEISERYHFGYNIAYSHAVIGETLKDEGKLDSALIEIELAIKKYNAILYTGSLPYLYVIRGEIYEGQQKINDAIAQYEKVIADDIATEKMSLIRAHLNLAAIYLKLQQGKKAKDHLDSSVLVQREINDVSLQCEIDKLYHQLYAWRGDYKKAYEHYANYVTARDSLDAFNRKVDLLGIESEYKIKKKEGEIHTLNAENRAKNIQLYSLIGFSILSLLLIGLIYNRYKNSLYVRKKLIELDQVKSRFFANISHEFRTPLTLVIGPIKRRLEESTNAKDKKELTAVYRNANRLHTLIDQLLDLSKLESGKMKISIQSCNLEQLVKMVYSYFTLLAESKGITYTLHCDGLKDGFVDSDKIEKIIFNLLSNAFKFTPEGGDVNLSATVERDKLIIRVSDSGIGIPENRIGRIFDRFYQVDDSVTRRYEGSGIGLALSKELATVHKGVLTAVSVKGTGSEFVLVVPIRHENYKDDILPEKTGEEKIIAREALSPQEYSSGINPLIDDESMPWALVVDDNSDMRQYLTGLLENEYRIVTASDGVEAFNKILELVPDIIVCDYMMPNMDGRVFCEKIKNHSLTSHIPVVMVTAKAGLESKLELLTSGADAFLTKPFDARELMVTLHNLIAQRKKINILPDHAERDTKKQPDEDFISTLKSIIAENYSDSGFGVEHLTDKMGISKTQLHRKLKAITDKTPVELLRTYRLEKAKHLLLDKGTQVGEVAYKVGYRNLSNFTKIFKEYSGVTPSEFMAEQSVPVETR